MRTIRDKKALITGAASGIGRAIALRLAREGADICLLDINEQGLADVVNQAKDAGVQAIAARCDVTQPAEIASCIDWMLEQWGYLDILVNNAGVGYYGPTHEMTQQQWDWLLAINLHAPIRFTTRLLPILVERPESHILNVASIAGIAAGGRFAAYHTSKFGLIGFTEAIRAEYGRQGVGVTALCPGPVLTDLYKQSPSGRRDGKTPEPPEFICTTIERITNKAIQAIRTDRRLVLVGWLAHVLYCLKRTTPGLLDMINRIGRRRRMKKKAAAAAGCDKKYFTSGENHRSET